MSEWNPSPLPESEGDYLVQYRNGDRGQICFTNGAWSYGYRHDRRGIIQDCEPIKLWIRLPDIPKPLPLPRRFRATCDGHPVVGVEFRPHMKVAVWSGPDKILLECDCVVDFIRHDRLENLVFIDPEETP